MAAVVAAVVRRGVGASASLCRLHRPARCRRGCPLSQPPRAAAALPRPSRRTRALEAGAAVGDTGGDNACSPPPRLSNRNILTMRGWGHTHDLIRRAPAPSRLPRRPATCRRHRPPPTWPSLSPPPLPAGHGARPQRRLRQPPSYNCPEHGGRPRRGRIAGGREFLYTCPRLSIRRLL